jgi:hypothetical protein
MRHPRTLPFFAILPGATQKTVLFTFLLSAFAATLSAQGTYTAASCNQSDVNAVINGPTHTAVNGDTINIPAGSCTWKAGVTVPSGIAISIIGNGTPSSGAGTSGASSSCSNTVLTDDLSSGSVISMSPSYGNFLSRISCIKFVPTTPSPGFGSPIEVVGTCTSSGCPNLRLDNITAPTSWSGIGIADDTFSIVVNVFGVADHNTVGDVPSSTNGVDFLNVSHASWLGVGGYGDNSWASPDTFGTAQEFYMENNTLSYAIVTDTDTNAGTGGGARWVCRFNEVNNISTGGGCTDHGTDTTGRARGGRQYEVYGNTGTCTNPSQGCPSFTAGRSGTGIIFGNTFTNSGGGFFKDIGTLDAQRAWRQDTPWASCDGMSPWDTNDGTTYYSGTIGNFTGLGSGVWTITDSGGPGWTTNKWAPSGAPYAFYDVTLGYGVFVSSSALNSLTLVFLCESCISFRPTSGDSYRILRSAVCMDQPARGAGLLVQGSTPTLVSTGSAGSVNEALDPIYEFEDSVPGGYLAISSNEASIIANRDFYIESINQGAQTSSTSPFNGASGTGHGTLANRPTTCTPHVGYWATDQGSWNQSGSGGQGELFVCTATNTWTLYYTPYTYPHPLTQGTGTGGNGPTNLVITTQ